MNEQKLINSIKEEIRTAKEFKNQRLQEIEKLNNDITYYSGQIDALNLTLSTLEKHKDEK